MKSVTLCIVGLLLSGHAQGSAADLTLQLLNHKSWTVADGAPNRIDKIAQTTDGTLWVAAPTGLYRFDGIRFVRFKGPEGHPFVSISVSTITASPDGGLWIGFRFGGISVLKNGEVLDYGEQEGLPVATVFSIATDQSGVTYAATSQGLYRLLLGR